jgi:hypothetical protein
MTEDVEDAFERFMYARSQLADADQVLRSAKLTLSRTFPRYGEDDLDDVADAVKRYGKCARRLAKAADMLADAVGDHAPSPHPGL